MSLLRQHAHFNVSFEIQWYKSVCLIYLGDFNKGNFTSELPKYKQFIKCPTREREHSGSLLHHSKQCLPRRPPGCPGTLGPDMVHLIPAYRQKLKLCKPVLRTSKQWTSEAVEDLQACLDCTDWEVFRTATNSLDEYTEAVTSYISFCEDSCVPSHTRVCYNNDKPWFTAKIKKLRLEKEEAFRRGDRDRYIESKYRFSKEVREAKRLYSEKLQHQFSANFSASVWKGLRLITNCKPRAPHSTNDPSLANNLNEFYCRFDSQWDSHDTIPRDTTLQPINCTSPTIAKALRLSTTAHLRAPLPPPLPQWRLSPSWRGT